MSLFPRNPRLRKILILTAVINFLSGLYVGYSIGFPAVYMAYDQLNTDCKSFKTLDACHANDIAQCNWYNATQTCGFSDGVECSVFTDESSCSSQGGDACSYNDNECQHVHGWTATQQGLFASSMIIGGTVGSFPIGPIMDKIGRCNSFKLLGGISLVCCLVMHVACAVKSYTFLVFTNIAVGFPIGAIQVLSPMYVGEMAPPKFAFQAGILIQVGITFGIFVMGVYGFAVQPSSDTIAAGAAFANYFQASIGGLTFFSAMVGVIGFFIPESEHFLALVAMAQGGGGAASTSESPALLSPTSKKTKSKPLLAKEEGSISNTNSATSLEVVVPESASRGYGDVGHNNNGGGDDDEDDDANEVPHQHEFERYSNLPFPRDAVTCFGWRKTHVLCYVVATVLSACMSLTGINSFIVYAPVIMKSAGMSSLVGNLLVDGWNFVTTLVSLPIAFRCHTTQTFNAGAILVTVTCCLSGVLMYPGIVENDTIRNWILGIAVMSFIAAFEIGMATAYYVIAQAMFPADARSFGTGYCIGIQYLFNVLINFLYPVGLQAFSPSGGSNQRGMSIWLMIFGVIGVFSTAYLVRFLGTSQYIAHVM